MLEGVSNSHRSQLDTYRKSKGGVKALDSGSQLSQDLKLHNLSARSARDTKLMSVYPHLRSDFHTSSVEVSERLLEVLIQLQG